MLNNTGSAAAALPTPSVVLKLLVKGFNVMEHRLLEGAVQLSQRRPPRIDLVSDADAAGADVVIIDANDVRALQWSAAQPWLAAKAVIWAGARTARPEHVVVDRHVKWPILPVLLYRALEQQGHRAARPPVPTSAPASVFAARSRVLVVDDSLAVRGYLRSLLERQGLAVHDVDSAETGIAAAATQRFACVLMDVLMPGVDGFEACRRIKSGLRAGVSLPVVMLSSKSSPFDRVRGKMAGCDSYLTKPVDPVQLQQVLARYVTATSPVATA